MGEPSRAVDISDHTTGVSAYANGDGRAVQEQLLNNINNLTNAINLLSTKLPIADEKSQSNSNTESLKTGTPGVLMVVATLVATITFQAAINPPGGFYPPKDNSTIITPSPSLGLDSDNQSPGTSVLGDNLLLFLIFDIIAFLASLSIILLFIYPSRKKFLRFLELLMWLAVVSTTIALTIALKQVFPGIRIPSILVTAFLGSKGCLFFGFWYIGLGRLC